jgi:hypothetical protein
MDDARRIATSMSAALSMNAALSMSAMVFMSAVVFVRSCHWDARLRARDRCDRGYRANRQH